MKRSEIIKRLDKVRNTAIIKLSLKFIVTILIVTACAGRAADLGSASTSAVLFGIIAIFIGHTLYYVQKTVNKLESESFEIYKQLEATK